MTRQLPWRLADAPDAPFPPAETALRQPDGLLAVGGDLHPVRLLNAYAGGIFPWFSEGEPILWWSPDPRMVFRTEGVHLSSRFRRQLRGSTWEITADTAFSRVMRACAAAPRPGQDGTWISPAMVEAYSQLHDLGFAHSFEVWDRQTLVGGIYGVAIGAMFFGESMFSGASGGSKIALAALASTLRDWGWELIDAQVENPHLLRMGAEHLPRADFLEHVRQAVHRDGREGAWTQAVGRLPAQRLAGG
ncbi:leucyl/phenylalanyl-tRNA--protein transferase [Stenotrophomonas geniculata]|uniref:leucyl/phenylalanyl-tRNA--protein transferase n=1 Tax=Stenotrophomonas geniculata TaxID=86188 RepID=UPI00066D66A3|nr:leucyl/phenylalanyl-tRNA--protein transferase [Stenotrophomonas geniculata]KPG81077.1 leucyl/phenylalanyl-tRNA--protein transferase [Stenotrophomonas maltophilia]MBA0241784.1 leucyl/phenylalanyl-tRNA--protein transferase [Stenotrophomonas maltophilia]MBA0245626.1 leucyl/phenylalanyl-tRNA--protein transferase [Stenotrophomonas maltophilia]MBA0305625.1 leucyl/phenylalanyl-tRNA--protein transferase [Stenotrophomonas maltophilia]MBA0438351.1 leucyl/phenylalanyl-tRNA--protein transferase [Stenot